AQRGVPGLDPRHDVDEHDRVRPVGPSRPISRRLLFRPVAPPLCPYTTLFRSSSQEEDHVQYSRARLATQAGRVRGATPGLRRRLDRKSTRLNSSHVSITYAVFCLKTARTSFYAIDSRSMRYYRGTPVCRGRRI